MINQDFDSAQSWLLKNLAKFSSATISLLKIDDLTSGIKISGSITLIEPVFALNELVSRKFIALQSLIINKLAVYNFNSLKKHQVKMIYRSLQTLCDEDNVPFIKPLVNHLLYRPPFIATTVVQQYDNTSEWANFFNHAIKALGSFEESTYDFFTFTKKIWKSYQEAHLNTTITFNWNRLKAFISIFDKILQWDQCEASLIKIAICLYFAKHYRFADPLPHFLIAYWLQLQLNAYFPNLNQYISVPAIINHAKTWSDNAYANSSNQNNNLTYYVVFILNLLLQALNSATEYISNDLSWNDSHSNQTGKAKFNLDELKKQWPQLSSKQLRFLLHLQTNLGNYTITDFCKLINCSYETGRYSLEQLAKLNILEKAKVQKHFVYSLNFNLF